MRKKVEPRRERRRGKLCNGRHIWDPKLVLPAMIYSKPRSKWRSFCSVTSFSSLAGRCKEHIKFLTFLDSTVNEDPGRQCGWKQPGPPEPASPAPPRVLLFPSLRGPDGSHDAPPTRSRGASPAGELRAVLLIST